MLKVFLLLNCMTCTFFGALFTFGSRAVVTFIGTVPQAFVVAVGAVLLVNAGLLAFTALRLSHMRMFVAFFVIGDAGWVALTVWLLASGTWIVGGAAMAVSISVALMVGALGFGQWYFGVRR